MKSLHFPLCCVVVLGLAALAQAQTFTVLYNFRLGADGGEPLAGVIQDSSGSLYSTTWGGGYSGGVVYEISATGAETVLYSFEGWGHGDGALPDAPLLRDSKGNLYGTTTSGGSENCTLGCGVVFKVDADGKETVLHTFTGRDGCIPEQGLVMGKSGVMFGTTNECGAHKGGTIFKVDSAGNFTRLHSFAGVPWDGGAPHGGHLTMDRSGSLYGVTVDGGAYGYGVLYGLGRLGTLSLLHSFKGGTKDGCDPLGSVAQGQTGDLYGTTVLCGSANYGTIWKVSKGGKETILHNLTGGTSDGCDPDGGVTQDPQGNLYGVASGCGAYGYGALYELSASGIFTVLHSFDYSDGADPVGEVLWTTNGTLFGTTSEGGTGGYGTVWEYVP